MTGSLTPRGAPAILSGLLPARTLPSSRLFLARMFYNAVLQHCNLPFSYSSLCLGITQECILFLSFLYNPLWHHWLTCRDHDCGPGILAERHRCSTQRLLTRATSWVDCSGTTHFLPALANLHSPSDMSQPYCSSDRTRGITQQHI